MTYMMTIQSKMYDRMSRTEGMLRPIMVGMLREGLFNSKGEMETKNRRGWVRLLWAWRHLKG